ncbi:hypothetical protein AHiyo1_47390 [Arthrobacter sp. Hiyo1]|nr:hypothetical protein AHiyo1_47390 [Arthrobacter sp. Hiyo1]
MDVDVVFADVAVAYFEGEGACGTGRSVESQADAAGFRVPLVAVRFNAADGSFRVGPRNSLERLGRRWAVLPPHALKSRF